MYHLFGIRHHGPGCARSLLRALDELQPDCLLIEGPPEADALLSLAAAEGMEPPVALLVYSPEEQQRAGFYPFAEFSPEWQAIRYGIRKDIPVRFIDLPQSNALALAKERDAAEKTPDEGNGGGAEGAAEEVSEEVGLRRDPLGWLGQAAGFGGGEEWWEHMVECRQDGTDLFAAIAEAMTAVRAESQPPDDPFEARRELLREASMRRGIRAAQKEGRERIAVVCGAWHVPALVQLPSAGADNELLKNLPKMKVEVTWIPWTYGRLAAESGYGAGVASPAWYEHLWRCGGRADAAPWFARVARLLRQADIDCSSAHVIECVRLADTLAAVRERPLAGLSEMMEAARTVLTTGEETPLQLIRRELIIGQRLGKIAEGVPTVPLQRDLEKRQKTLRLKVSASEETLDLDLRKDNDLARSRLLHRLRLLQIDWGEVRDTRSGKGTFRETWKLQWQPEFAMMVIESAPYGNTVPGAASAKVIQVAVETRELSVLTDLVSRLLLADLPDALQVAMHELENRAAVTGDVPQLMDAVPPLAKMSRYGDVRQTDVAQVLHVLDGIIVRVCIGLAAACQSLDDDAAATMAERVSAFHSALKLLEGSEHQTSWLSALDHFADSKGVHNRVRGLAARILFDDKEAPGEATSDRMSRALSRGASPEESAGWLEGFLSGSGMVLVHDDALFRILDQWVCGLGTDHFTSILPLVRRTFALFPPMERREIGGRVKRASGPSGGPEKNLPADDWDEERARKVIPVLRMILGQ